MKICTNLFYVNMYIIALKQNTCPLHYNTEYHSLKVIGLCHLQYKLGYLSES